MTREDLIKAWDSVGKEPIRAPILIYSKDTTITLEKMGLAVKDENGVYWCNGIEIKILENKDK